MAILPFFLGLVMLHAIWVAQKFNVICCAAEEVWHIMLQAGVLGIDLRRHRDFAFAPGEVRPLETAAEIAAPVSKSFTCRNPPRCF